MPKKYKIRRNTENPTPVDDGMVSSHSTDEGLIDFNTGAPEDFVTGDDLITTPQEVVQEEPTEFRQGIEQSAITLQSDPEAMAAADTLQEKLNLTLPEGDEADEFINILDEKAKQNEFAIKKNKELEQSKATGRDVALGLLKGPGKFIEKGGEILEKLGVPNHSLQIFNEEGDLDIKILSEKEVEAAGGMKFILNPTEPTTEAGKTAQILSAYLFGAAVTAPLIAAASTGAATAGLTGTAAQAATAGAAVGVEGGIGVVMADPDQVRLATMLDEIPFLNAIVPDYLADMEKGNETFWENKIKGGIDEALTVFGMAAAGKLGSMAWKSFKSAKMAKIAKQTDNIKVKPTAAEVVEAEAKNVELQAQAVEEMTQPIFKEEIEESVSKAVDDLYAPKKTPETPPRDVPEVHDVQSNTGLDGKTTTIDAGDMSVAKQEAKKVAVEPEVPTPAERAVKENAEFSAEMEKRGVSAADVADAGDMSSTAGLKTADGQLLNDIKTPITPSPDAGLTKGLITKENGVMFLDTARIADSADLTVMFNEAAERAMKANTKGVTFGEIKMAGQKELDDLNGLLTRDVELPLTAHEVVAANTLLNAADNTILKLTEKVLGPQASKVDLMAFGKALAAKSDIEEVVCRGAQANGQALNAYKIDVTDSLADYVPKRRNVLKNDGSVVEDFTLYGKHNKKVKIVDAIDPTTGKIKPGIKAKDVNGKVIDDIDAIVPGADEAAAIQRASEINQKAARQRSKDITNVIKNSTADLKAQAMIIDDIARKSPQNLGKVVTKISKLDQVDQFLYKIWVNGILSGPKTHAANIIGNTTTILSGIPTKYATEWSKMLATGWKEGSMAAANAQVIGIFQGILDGAKLFTGKTRNELLEIGSKIEHIPLGGAKKVRPEGFAANLWSYVPGALDSFISAPGTLLYRSDLFFKGVAYRSKLAGTAVEAATRQNLKGEEFKTFVKNFIDNPPDFQKAEAVAHARTQTFTNQVGPKTEGLKNFLAMSIAGKWAIPFLNTPSNILVYTAKHTPVINLLFDADRAALGRIGAGKALPADYEVIGRVATGTAIMGLATYMTLGGNLTGSGPSNYKEKQAKELTGWRAYSFKIGDKYISYERIEPFASILAFTADITASIANADEQIAGDSVMAGIAGNMRLWADKTFVQGAIRMMKAATSGEETSLMKLIRGFGDGMIPYVGLRKTAGSYIDSTMRDVDVNTVRHESTIGSELYGVVARLRDSVGMAKGSPPKRDIWGEPRSYEETWLPVEAQGPVSLLSPIKVSHDKKDPVNELIAQSGMVISPPTKQMNGVDLTNKEYSRYVELSGKKAKLYMDRIVKSGRFDGKFIGEGSQFQSLVREVFTKSRRSVYNQMYREFSALKRRKRIANQELRSAKEGTTKGVTAPNISGKGDWTGKK